MYIYLYVIRKSANVGKRVFMENQHLLDFDIAMTPNGRHLSWYTL